LAEKTLKKFKNASKVKWKRQKTAFTNENETEDIPFVTSLAEFFHN